MTELGWENSSKFITPVSRKEEDILPLGLVLDSGTRKKEICGGELDLKLIFDDGGLNLKCEETKRRDDEEVEEERERRKEVEEKDSEAETDAKVKDRSEDPSKEAKADSGIKDKAKAKTKLKDSAKKAESEAESEAKTKDKHKVKDSSKEKEAKLKDPCQEKYSDSPRESDGAVSRKQKSKVQEESSSSFRLNIPYRKTSHIPSCLFEPEHHGQSEFSRIRGYNVYIHETSKLFSVDSACRYVYIKRMSKLDNAIQQVINEGWNSFACKRNYSDFKDLIETNILEKLLEDYDLSANVEQIGDYRPIHLPKTRITFHANPITLANNFNRDSGTVSLNQGLGISKKSNTTPYPLPNEEGGDADFNKR